MPGGEDGAGKGEGARVGKYSGGEDGAGGGEGKVPR